MSLSFRAEVMAPRQAAPRAEDPEVRLPARPHSRRSGPSVILGTQLGWLPAILHSGTDRSRPGLTREASTSAPPLAYQCPALGARVHGACQHPNSLPQPAMQQGRVYTVLEVPGIRASCSGARGGDVARGPADTGKGRCPHAVRVLRCPGRRPPNRPSPRLCQVFSQQTPPLICMAPPTFTEATTEPQRVES